MGATYKLKRKKADGTLEDVILQGVITDLGEQEDNALAEQAILELLKPTSVQTGSYLYTYHTTCRNDAVMAICSKTETVINITYISSLNGTVKYSSYDIEREELQSECWRLMADRNPSFESVSIGEYDGESQYNNHINAQGFYIDHDTTDGSDYLSFNINDGVEATDRDGNSLVLNSGFFGACDSDGNWLEIRPSAITHNDNEYQFPNKSGTLAVTEDIPSVGNGTITIKQASLEKGSFTVNQSGDTTIELSDTTVIQTHTTTNANYPLLFKQASGITTTGATTNTSRYANNIYVNPSTGTVYATTFNGALKGNADTATNADKLGNLFASQYATKQDIADLTQLTDIDSIDTWVSEPQFTSTDGGITWSEQAAMYDGDDSQIWEGWIAHRVPLVAGDNVTFEVQNNQVKVNATGGGGGGSSLYGDWELPSQSVSMGENGYWYFDVPFNAKTIEICIEKMADITFMFQIFDGDWKNIDTSYLGLDTANFCSIVIDVLSRSAILYGYDYDNDWPAMVQLGTLSYGEGAIGGRLVIETTSTFSADAIFTVRGTSYFSKASEEYYG